MRYTALPPANYMRLHRFHAFFALAAGCAASLAAGPAYAEPSATDRAVAQTLFDQGRALMDEGRFAEACSAFARSQKLDPGAGTRLNLALCHEAEGRTATAWMELNEALSQAKRDHREDREQLAQQHIAALTPNVPHALLKVNDKSEELEIRLDDVLLDRAVWDGPIPIDPGDHVVVASAPGKRPFSARPRFAPGETLTVVVPPLETGEAAAPGANGATADRPEEGHRTLGWVVASGGLASVAVGAYFGVRALDAKSESDRLCPRTPCTDREGTDLSKDAVTFGWGANIGIGVGLVALGVGTYLVLTAKPSARAAAASKLVVSPYLRGGAVAVTF